MSNHVEIDKLTGKVMEIADDYQLRPYKSYAALLTQYAPIVSQTSGALIVGGRYTITTYNTNDDFSNIAQVESGTINTTGCVFIATGTTPTHWAHSSDLSFDGAPITTIFENNIGDIMWEYGGAGYFTGTLTGKFISNKTGCIISGGNSNPYLFYMYRVNDNVIGIDSYDSASSMPTDGALNKTFIEIRIYN